MEISDDQLLAEAREMALYVRFLEKENARLEQQVATLTADVARLADPPTSETAPGADTGNTVDQHNP